MLSFWSVVAGFVLRFVFSFQRVRLPWSVVPMPTTRGVDICPIEATGLISRQAMREPCSMIYCRISRRLTVVANLECPSSKTPVDSEDRSDLGEGLVPMASKPPV
jgi:hypothetical protein